MAHATGGYYVPHGSHWPIVGSIGLTTLMVGFALMLNGAGSLSVGLVCAGVLVMLVMLFGWFGTVIRENEHGYYNAQVDRSFRWGMSWFIFSEVMFFAAFFGALFYARNYAVPWLGGAGAKASTNIYLWPNFDAVWPTNGPDNVGGAFETVPAFDIPLINTMILLSSGFTITMAHWAMKEGNRVRLVFWHAFTILLGVCFLYLQAHEYIHGWEELNLTLGTGIYGSTFYMLTGFHGLHVTLGVIMLAVILGRILAGHFTPKRHFAFEAVAWYWHFVDVVWLGLFIFVYVL